ncbi:MAG TPA: TonB-dependent receptor [Allosphingosinicella sp.]|nr:TonB-dependent receptor [Allosphingosinicella sp.]
MTRRLLPILLLLGAAGPALAQQPQDQRDIIVTGRGLGAGAGEAVYDVATLDRDQLADSASGRLEDVLLSVPGFQLFRRSDATSANPTSQGATLRALGGNASSRALVLLDGVPQTDPFGGWIAWPAYDPRRLASVRVVRGGGSGVYGPGALAGTIALQSAGPDALGGLGAGVDYGSRDSVDAHAGIGERLGGGFFTLTGAYARGDGFTPTVPEQQGPADRPAPYKQASVDLRAVAPIPGGIELQANLLAFHDSRERGTAFSAIRTTGADGSLRLVGPRWSLLGYVQARNFTNSFASVNAARTVATRTSLQYDVPATGLGTRFEWRPRIGRSIELRLGGDWRRTEGQTDELFAFVNGAGTKNRQAGGRTDTEGLFAEASWTAGRLVATLGGRVDRWSIADGFLRERMLATAVPLTSLAFPNRAGWEPTGRGGLAWQALPGLTLRAAAYLGWRLPTLNELYRPFRLGTDATANDPFLEPERMRGAELGVEWRPSKAAKLGLTFFDNRLEDAIANVTLGKGPGNFPIVGFVAAGGTFFERENIDAIRSRGVELDGRLTLGAWSLGGGLSWTDARVRSSGLAAPLDGLRPAQTPRGSAAATLAWHGPRGLLGAFTTRYVGGQYEDDLNSRILPGAVTFDAAVLVPVARRLAVSLRGENLADKRVYAGIGGNGIIERATPRTLWVGLRFGLR